MKIRNGWMLIAAVFVGMILAKGFRDADAVPFRDPHASGGVSDTGGYPQFSTDYAVSVSTTSTTSGAAGISAGTYTITCDVASNIRQGATGIGAATTSYRRIPADYPYPILVTGRSDTYLNIRGTASGTCVISLDRFPY